MENTPMARWWTQPSIMLTLSLALSTTILLHSGVSAQETTDPGTLDKATVEKLLPKRGYSPYVDRSYPTRPLFGDTHLHTSQSFDAIAFGCFLGPEDAYRFARGEAVNAIPSRPLRLPDRMGRT
jgi:hypothetical protein